MKKKLKNILLVVVVYLSSLLSMGNISTKQIEKYDNYEEFINQKVKMIQELKMKKIKIPVSKIKFETIPNNQSNILQDIDVLTNQIAGIKKFYLEEGEFEMEKVKFDESDLHWLALNVYHEARGEGLRGMIAVAMITLNRVNHPRFPDTVKKVVQQKHQFSWYSDGKSDNPTDTEKWKLSKEVANLSVELYNNAALYMEDDFLTHGCTFYYASGGANKIKEPYWVKGDNMKNIITIGNHSFFKI